ncbi:MAG: glycosyltransferase [Kibdelosporangium sp.]
MTLVGIPARNEAATIASVAQAADAGLHAAFPDSDSMIVLADNGSTDGTPEKFLAAATAARQLVVRSDGSATGKGTNVLALMSMALEHDAEQLILLDADVRSGEPAWIGSLATAVDAALPTLAVPTYRRNRYEANTTNHLAGPLVAALFGTPLQQPIGGEFALNRVLLQRARRWPTPGSVSLYGIDIWLTANALREGHQVLEVPLGVKLHNSPFPKILHLPLQVLDSLFQVALRMDRPRPAVMDRRTTRRSAVDSELVPQDPALVARVASTVRGYLTTHEAEVRRIFPASAGLRGAPWGMRIETEDWPHLLADAVETLAGGLFRPVRDHLIALYINRVLSFWDEIADLSSIEIDALLDRQAGDTVKAVAERLVVFDGTPGPGEFDRGHWSGIQ